VLADSDTRWKWGALTARRLVPDARIDGLLLRGRATPTPRQLAEVGVEVDACVDSLREVGGAGFVRTAAARAVAARAAAPGAAEEVGDVGTAGAAGETSCAEGDLGAAAGGEGGGAAGAGRGYDVVVLACVGGAVQAMLHGLAHAAGAAAQTGGDGGVARDGSARHVRRPAHVRRPVIVTGYVGVVYEKLADGLLLRHGADLVLANSRYDAERFRSVYEGVGVDAGSVVEVALPFLGGAPYQPPGGERPFTVVFAAQPSVPASRADRRYLLRRAAEHARAHPEREVLVKLRSKPGEHTTHIEEQPYQKLAARLPGGLPPNCRLVYGNMGEQLDRTDLLVTVSSTAALESLHRGVPTAVLTDLGVREVLGNHHFLGSGCLASWDELDAGRLPEADPEWAAQQGVHPVVRDGASGPHGPGASRAYGPGEAQASQEPYERAFDAARERVAELAARDELPLPAPYYTASTAPGYLPGVLARYGFDVDGAPLPGAAGSLDGAGHEHASGLRHAVAGAVRGALRDAARGAYRQGVQRVAPVIRRMGEL
jgi:hypothetical protein